jgi:hypothetical protein
MANLHCLELTEKRITENNKMSEILSTTLWKKAAEKIKKLMTHF